MDLRHEPYDRGDDDVCDGVPMGRPCPECGHRLCACELGYGHDCEA